MKVRQGDRPARRDSSSRTRASIGAGRSVPAAVLCGLLVLLCLASPAPGQDPPAQLTVTVVPPANAEAPRPTGNLIVSVNGTELATLPLMPGTEPLTALTPLTAATFGALGQNDHDQLLG